MRDLGHPRFRLVGHDRGGRVAHRLCIDHPDVVSQLAVLDISPTRTMYARTDQAFATAYYHWFFLIQPFDLPERLIGADPAYYLQRKLGGWGRASRISIRALAEYALLRRSGDDSRDVRDYASASIDLAHDAASDAHRLACPVLVLWGDRASCIDCSRARRLARRRHRRRGARALRSLRRGRTARKRRASSRRSSRCRCSVRLRGRTRDRSVRRRPGARRQRPGCRTCR
jgi:pimeloyl-ACP methyl ester carboxylesterase